MKGAQFSTLQRFENLFRIRQNIDREFPNFLFSSFPRFLVPRFPYLIFIEKCSIIEISIDAEVIVGARRLNIDSMEGGKHYARSYPSDISRTDRL